MPHLYLPTEHSDADLVLAADIAQAVASEDLFVAWTYEAGPGGTPEVEAVVREAAPKREVNPFAELFVAMMQGVVNLWQHLANPAPRRAELPPGVPEGSARPAYGESSR